MDMAISGNTGTRKTKLVDVLQLLLYSTGIIKNPKAVVVDAVDYEDFSKDDKWDENIAKAKGGLLVIENAQKLLPQKASNDNNRLDKLFKRNTKTFGNAREVRNVFDKAVKNQSRRLQKLKEASEYTSDMSNVLFRADIEDEENLKDKDPDTKPLSYPLL